MAGEETETGGQTEKKHCQCMADRPCSSKASEDADTVRKRSIEQSPTCSRRMPRVSCLPCLGSRRDETRNCSRKREREREKGNKLRDWALMSCTICAEMVTEMRVADSIVFRIGLIFFELIKTVMVKNSLAGFFCNYRCRFFFFEPSPPHNGQRIDANIDATNNTTKTTHTNTY